MDPSYTVELTLPALAWWQWALAGAGAWYAFALYVVRHKMAVIDRVFDSYSAADSADRAMVWATSPLMFPVVAVVAAVKGAAAAGTWLFTSDRTRGLCNRVFFCKKDRPA